MKKDEIRALEEAYAKKECPVVSNNSANRGVEDVPMVVPEINADHIEIINAQRKRLGTKRGFIAVKSNCSLQSYVPAIHPLMDLGVTKVLACTYQAISGAGKTFETYPDILDNVIPYIGGEEEKSEQEPMKLWGHIEGDKIVNATTPSITHSASACRFPTAIRLRCSSPWKRRSHRRKSSAVGQSSAARHRSSSCRAHRSSSCTTLRKQTVRRQNSTVNWSMVWPFPSADCARIPSMTTSSFAFPTTRCAAQQAAVFCLQSCSQRRAILTDTVQEVFFR